jgi:hypothetical protein
MATRVKRSQERLVFYYRDRDTATSVKRSSVQRAAKALGMDETGFLHLAAAALVRSFRGGAGASRKPAESARLTDAELAAIRSIEPQDVEPTRSFLALLGK